MIRRTLTLGLAILAAAPVLAKNGYFRSPAIHHDTVVFVAEGDLWRAGIAGDVATRLTSHTGEENHPAISPNGTVVAFSAAYEGKDEVYTMPLSGGLPTRHTWDGGGAVVVGWTPDGHVLYSTRRYATLPDTQLVDLDPITGGRRLIPLSQAAEGSYEGTGTTLFFTRFPFQGSHTARYRGGTAQSIWRYDPDREARPLTSDYTGTSCNPMWWQGRVYFISDRDGFRNIWSMGPDGDGLRQHTSHAPWNVQSAALSEGRIAYQLGADIHLLDLATDTSRRLDITLASDFDQLRQRWIEKPTEYLTAVHIAPDGGRVALTARGQVFVVPVTQGRLVEASRRPGVRYRQARFMPDGESLVTLSDESGEVEFWRLSADGVGDPAQLSFSGDVLRFDGIPSPDGKTIAFTDKNDVLWLLDAASGRITEIARSQDGGFEDLAFSPDGRWLAYVSPAPNSFPQIFAYHLADASILEITGNRTASSSPAWSPDGTWLYFLSERNLASAVSSPWGLYQPEPFMSHPTEIFAVALRAEARFPFAPADELHSDLKKKTGGDTDKNNGAKVVVEIDEDGLSRRLYKVPVDAGDYSSLSVNGDRLFWLSREEVGERSAALMALDIAHKEGKPVTLVPGIKSYELSSDGTKLQVLKDTTIAVADAAAKTITLDDAKIDLSRWRFSLDPREEWRQMFTEAWRLERDYFYDRGMHGVDWKGVLDRYLPLVDRVSDRGELSDLLGQMVSELSALHIFVYGGDERSGDDDVVPASLGAVLERDEDMGGYRVTHVYAGDPDYPDELAPLARPGVDVEAGSIIIAIDGTAALSVREIAALLRDKAGRQVRLSVVTPTGTTHDVIVTPITPREEADLRYHDWELSRRQRVEARGEGSIGYVHLRAMGGGNWTEWARNFYPVFDRAGLIIDVRHNRGGNIDSWILEKLLRRAWFYWQPRVGRPYWNMQYAFRGHLVVLTDAFTASDGEAFAEGFRRLGLGPVIGTRTWGGEIWLSSNNFLVDKGIATAAETGVFGPEGAWLIEGHGVDPDTVVDNLPYATFLGEDAQLDAALAYLRARIAEDPVTEPVPPPHPDKSFRAP